LHPVARTCRVRAPLARESDLLLVRGRHHTLAHKPGATVSPAETTVSHRDTDDPHVDPVLGAHPPHGRRYRIHHQT
jgi:hypothetical protein